MRMMSGWMRAGIVAAMMVAAEAGAQATAEDATQVASQQSDVQARTVKVWAKVNALSPADTKVQLEKLQAMNSAGSQVQRARIQAQLAKLSALNSAESQLQSARIQSQLAKLAPMQAEMQARMLPMMAKIEVGMAPMQAEMMARSAAMQAHMMARGLMLQDGMVAVGDPQVKDDLFAGTEKFAAGASDVTDVNLGPDMLGMVSGKHGGDMAHKLNFMVVRTYEYPKPGMYNPADVDVYRRKLKAGNWNCFIHTQESKTGESTDICNRPLPNGQGNEMVILTVEPKELTFIHMSGTGSLADLSKMGAMGGYGGNIPTPPTPPSPPSPPNP